MHQLLRRVAMGLTVPLAIGAPVVLLAAPAQAAVPMVVLTPNANPSVYGQEVRVTAAVFNGEETNVVSQGSIQFVVDAVEQGPPIHLDSSGHALSPALVDEAGLPLSVTVGSDFHSVSATFIPDPDTTYDEASGLGPYQQFVNKAGSSIAVLPTASTLVADMTGAPPGGVQTGSTRPSGAVQFLVDGQVVGTNDVVNGSATLSYQLPPGSHTLAASYSGDDRYAPSVQTGSRRDPLLEARVISDFGRSKSGWYRSAVSIWFVCKPQGSELVEDCPGDVTLKKSGKNQSVTRTIHALDGGSATLTVGGIDIDRDDPVITVTGRSCTATDKLSGVKGRCHMRIAPDGSYRAVALDKAGNRAVERGVVD